MEFFKEIRLELDGTTLVAEGPLGKIIRKFGGEDVQATPGGLFIRSKSSYRTFISAVRSIASGLVSGYYVELDLSGLGFRFLRMEDTILLKLGYSHYIKIPIPRGVHIIGYKKKLIIFGLSFSEVRRVVGLLKNLKKRDPYKGKGVLLKGEVLKLKIGKRK